MGLGEAGMVLHPEMKGLMKRAGTIVLDVGYGVYGSEVLNVIDGLPQHLGLKIYLVVNIGRPMTNTKQAIIEEARRFRHLNGLINNSHLGPETTRELVIRGAKVVAEAAQELKQPVIATSALVDIAVTLSAADVYGQAIWPLKRYMPAAFW